MSVIIARDLNIRYFGFDLQFPSYKLKLIGLERTELTESFSQVGFHEVSPRLLRVGGYKANGKQDYSSGVLLTLIFRIIKPSIKANEFRIAATYDDIGSDSLRTGTIQKKQKKKEGRLKNIPPKQKAKTTIKTIFVVSFGNPAFSHQ